MMFRGWSDKHEHAARTQIAADNFLPCLEGN